MRLAPTLTVLVPAAAALLAALAFPAPEPCLREDPALVLAQLRERVQDERRVWREVYRDARGDEERATLRAEFPLADLVDPLASLADRAKGTDVEAQAWIEIYRLGVLVEDRATFQRAVERLTSDCLAAPSLGAFALELAYGAPPWGVPAAQEALRRILAGTQDRTTRATALSQLALLLGLDPALGEAGRTEARALLERIRTEFGGEMFLGQSAGRFVEGALFEIEHLREGQVVPDFELPDQDGVRFKLSDYRGQVVLLDFWGFV